MSRDMHVNTGRPCKIMHLFSACLYIVSLTVVLKCPVKKKCNIVTRWVNFKENNLHELQLSDCNI